MQVKTSKNLLAILAVAVAVALPTTASAVDPTITVNVNGADVSFQGVPVFDEDAGYWSSSLVASSPDWSLTGFIVFGEFPGDEKAFIDYSLHAVGGSDITSFTVKLNFPFAHGAYTGLDSNHSSTITDGGSAQLATVAVGVSAFSFIHTALLDNAVVADAQISKGCAGTDVAGFQITCQSPVSVLNLPVSTASHGTLGVALSFTVSPHDTFSLAGNVDLVGTAVVPEPTTYLSMLAGLLGLFGVIARRRIR
jgi:hypothetical protein